MDMSMKHILRLPLLDQGIEAVEASMRQIF